MTTGLPSGWKPAYDWASGNGIVEDLTFVIAATCIDQIPISFGTLLVVISSDDAFALLDEWSTNEPSVSPLLALANSHKSDPSLLKLYPPLYSERSASRQFSGDTDLQYLIALLTGGIPRLPAEDIKWLETLRLWVLAHAMNRAMLGNNQDNWLRIVSSKLRLAFENKANWIKLFLSLKSRHLDFDQLSRLLIQKSESLLSDRTSSLEDIKRKTLRGIIKVARREHAKDDRQSFTVSGLTNLLHYKANLPNQPVITYLTDNESGDLSQSQWVSNGEDEDSGFLSFEVETEQSFTHQQLRGNGILLYATEELQFLPFSWNKLNSIEQSRIEDWITTSLNSPPPEIRFIASITFVARALGRSLKRTLSLPINKEYGNEWTLNPDGVLFSRTPPRREPGWRPSTEAHLGWINSLAEKQTFPLPPIIQTIFKEALAKNPLSACLGDFWNTGWTGSAEQLFRSELSKISSRITGSMLATALPQQIFQNSGDQTFSRLLSSHPQTALPSSCSYASWSTDLVANSLSDIHKLTANESGTQNAMGSALDPIENRLKESITSAIAKIAELKTQNDFVGYHNAYTTYLTVALLASTGARPIRDPFEKLSHFDFQAQFVYINDKTSGDSRQGRIVPIPNELCQIIQIDYLHHLNLLSQQVSPFNPYLAEDISKLVSDSKQTKMPLLFLLSVDGSSWLSVSEKGIASLKLFDWPLPLNHFRHRLSKQLRIRNIDPEIIDSILGHAETGSSTHGDYSFRVWWDDMQLARPALNSAFSSLGFARIKPLHEIQTPRVSPQQTNSLAERSPIEFGELAREKQRRQRFIAIVKDARLHIKQFLDGRTLTELSETEIDKLSRELLFNYAGTPHANGHIKYRVLLKRIEREWNNHGKKCKVSKRYQFIGEESSPFTNQAPNAIATLKSVQRLLSEISLPNIGRERLNDCAVFAAVLLCIENRISDKRLLSRILKAESFRLVVLQGIPYLEYAETLNAKSRDIPTKRFKISDRTAALLDRLYGASTKGGLIIPDRLKQVNEDICFSLGTAPFTEASNLINALADLVDQVNAINLPGIVAGYLGGRVNSYSLQWKDWTRLELNYPINISLDDAPDDAGTESINLETLISAKIAISPPKNISQAELLQNAKSFFASIRELLKSYQAKKSDATALTRRVVLAREIQRVIHEYDGKISTAIQLLGKWSICLLYRKKGAGVITLSSVSRYLTALSTSFTEIGYHSDVLNMDDEDITLFYSDIISTTKAKDSKYVLERLSNFHSWAKREFAIEDPDWHELPEVFSTLHVSPGIITEIEYQRALSLIKRNTNINRRAQLASQLLLLLCYRFGLRGKEALGLIRSDLDMSDDLMVVYVQNNRYRSLKTQHSRRQVPLLFKLSSLEEKLLTNWLNESESLHGNDLSAAVFSDGTTSNGLMDGAPIKRLAIAALKIATSNSDINLHHARHSAANFIGLAISHANLETWNITSPILKPQSASLAEEILLGRCGQTRRKTWALSRFLGHVRRETTCGNYIHFLGNLVDQYTHHWKINDGAIKLNNSIDLDTFPPLAEIDTSLLNDLEPKTSSPSLSQLLRLMRLIARGKNTDEAANSLGTQTSVADELMHVLNIYGGKVNLSASKQTRKQTDISHHLKLIQRLKEPAWNRLINFALDLEKSKTLPSKTSITIDAISEMLGATRQIILWEERHFSLLKEFIAYMSFSSDDFNLVKTNQTSAQLEQLIREFNFDVIPLSNHKKKKAFQMDAAESRNGMYSVKTRCVFVYAENDSRPIRNSVELLVSFISYAVAIKSN